MDDEFEIEVTNLNNGATQRHHLADATNTTEAEPSQDPDGDAGEPPIAPQRTPRRQRTRTAIVSGIVLLAVVLVVALNPVTHAAFWAAFGLPTPIPTATPLPGLNAVYLLRGAPWATVTLDGKQPPNVSFGVGPTLLRLPPGRHTLIVSQTPFPMLHCTVSAPASSRDTCPLIQTLNATTPEFGDTLHIIAGARALDLGARFNRLPSNARAALVAAVARQLSLHNTPTTIAPGDHYLRDDGSVAIAQTTLQGVFVPALVAPEQSGPADDPSCISFCDVSGLGIEDGGTWDIVVALRGSWRITDARGNVVVDHAPLMFTDPPNMGIDSLLHTQITTLWVGFWQVNALDGYVSAFDAACQAATQMISSIPRTIGEDFGMSVFSGQSLSDPDQGCAIDISPGNPPNTDHAYLYYHFGAMVATNDLAHTLFPTLPLASAHERALTQVIITSNEQS